MKYFMKLTMAHREEHNAAFFNIAFVTSVYEDPMSTVVRLNDGTTYRVVETLSEVQDAIAHCTGAPADARHIPAFIVSEGCEFG